MSVVKFLVLFHQFTPLVQYTPAMTRRRNETSSTVWDVSLDNFVIFRSDLTTVDRFRHVTS